MVITKGEGTTESERYLAALAERSFLNLWSYPNPFIDKKVGSMGKELCDLLVVCGGHVIVFSDKTVEWPSGSEPNLAWQRWYRRAVEKSVRQVQGAARWIREHPSRIFLDPMCTSPLPLPLPATEHLQIHGIIVARGAGAACQSYFGGGSGSLLINPDIRGEAHYRQNPLQPFTIGEVNPGGIFVHVLDDGCLDIVMKELDTISDFTHYLQRKEELFRANQLVTATGEEDLVAYYLTHMETEHDHGFSRPDGRVLGADDVLSVDGGYSALTTNKQYIAKKQADKISYLWDALIQSFTDHMLAGTTLVPNGENQELSLQEVGVRHMALVPRFLRRSYGFGIQDAMIRGASEGRFFRAFLPTDGSEESDTGFFFLTLKLPRTELGVAYDQYRSTRSAMLETYALLLLRRYAHLSRVIGVAVEPPGGEGSGSSEDLIYAEPPDWTPELISDLERRQQHFDIMQERTSVEYAHHTQEWPELNLAGAGITKANRKQRRRRAAAERRRKK